MGMFTYGTLCFPVLGALVITVFLGIWQWTQNRLLVANISAKGKTTTQEAELTITAADEFDWKTTEPLQLRPFRGKEKYNLTMAIEALDPLDLIQIDRTYQQRLSLRQKILEEHHDTVIAVNDSHTADPRTHDAVSELYSFILGKYLPLRYPTMFKLHSATHDKYEIFENLVTGVKWPTSITALSSTIQGLEILAQTVDEEFLILLPDTLTTDDQPKYILQAYETCFPSLFNTREKLGLRLADIHSPVPRYAEKIERSMDRFFAKMKVGRAVKRANWSVTTETDLFAAFGYSPDSELRNRDKNDPIKPEELKIDKTVLRCERQTLHRLPNTKALVFAFHTYTYPLSQIKDEGLGEELAVAIEGLTKGNVPEMHAYKSTNVWGDAVKAFLRS